MISARFKYNRSMCYQNAGNADYPLDHRQKRVAELLRRLEKRWSPGDWKPDFRPIDALIGTILSQNTSDTNTSRAYASLRARFPDWKQVASAPVDELVDTIRVGGLASRKAPTIQSALRQILPHTQNDPNAEFSRLLRSMRPEEALDWLTSLKGVGPKTAACVLLFSEGIPVVPVDTHVFRVSKRLGIIDQSISADGAHRELVRIVPSSDSYRFHMHLINHGRTVCKARNPACDACPLNDICCFAAATTGAA
jgi:endonuclease III